MLPMTRKWDKITIALGGADEEGSVGGDIFFHTEKWGPPAALSALLFFWGFSFSSKYLFQGVMKKLEIRHTSKGGFGFVRSLIRFIGSLNLGMNG